MTDIPSETNKPEDEWSSPASVGKQHPTTATPSIRNTKNTESPPTSSIAKKRPEPSIFDEIDNEPAMDQISVVKMSKNEETKQKRKSPTIDKRLPASSVLGLFDDDVDDPNGADLFGAKFVAKPSNISKDQGAKVQPKSKPTSSTSTKTSLFGDHDDDGGDDLFGGPPPLPEPIKQSQPTKKVNQKIFSDDSSDDDLFGGGKIVAQKNPPKSSAGSSSSYTSTIPKTSKNTKASEKLFSDSEDDDLFGGSKSKSTG